VRGFDDNSCGSIYRLQNLAGSFEHTLGDIRDPEAISWAIRGVDGVCHSAFVNSAERLLLLSARLCEESLHELRTVFLICL